MGIWPTYFVGHAGRCGNCGCPKSEHVSVGRQGAEPAQLRCPELTVEKVERVGMVIPKTMRVQFTDPVRDEAPGTSRVDL